MLEEKGEWFRISYKGRTDVWVKMRTAAKMLVTPVPGDGMSKWREAEVGASAEG